MQVMTVSERTKAEARDRLHKLHEGRLPVTFSYKQEV